MRQQNVGLQISSGTNAIGGAQAAPGFACIGAFVVWGLASVVWAGNPPPAKARHSPPVPTLGSDVNLLGLSRGSASWLGKAWFTREKSATELEDEEDAEEEAERQQELAAKGLAKTPATVVPAKKASLPFELSCTITNSLVYETRPAKIADSRPDWRWGGELALELEWEVSDTVTITPSLGVASMRYASRSALDAEEPSAGLLVAWKLDKAWTVSFRMESFWDLTPGFGTREFAAFGTVARLQYDLPNPGNKSPMHWQFFGEAARSLAQPSDNDFYGFALGVGNALRLVPQKLTLQTQAGVSYADYPRFNAGLVERQGFNSHAACALVWSPSKTVSVSLGIEFMRSAETGPRLRFDDVSVPLAVKISF